MIKRLLKRYIYACVAEQLNDVIRSLETVTEKRMQAYLEKYITDVNDIKSDYLKRYLEARINNNDLSIQRLNQLADTQKEQIEFLQERIEILEEIIYMPENKECP